VIDKVEAVEIEQIKALLELFQGARDAVGPLALHKYNLFAFLTPDSFIDLKVAWNQMVNNKILEVSSSAPDLHAAFLADQGTVFSELRGMNLRPAELLADGLLSPLEAIEILAHAGMHGIEIPLTGLENLINVSTITEAMHPKAFEVTDYYFNAFGITAETFPGLSNAATEIGFEQFRQGFAAAEATLEITKQENIAEWLQQIALAEPEVD